MFDYIIGTLAEINPAEAVVDCQGLGFDIMISVETYSAIQDRLNRDVKLYLHHILREDDECFYGFSTRDERTLFKMLISVSGVGPGTARMMLSSMSKDDLQNAIVGQDIRKIKSIKGIGTKTAERIILELKDKVVKGSGGQQGFAPISSANSKLREEAFNALILLGFTKPNVDKALDMVLMEDPAVTLENLIKKSLKIL